MAAAEEVLDHENDGFNVLGLHFKPCNPNGWWPSVQRNATTYNFQIQPLKLDFYLRISRIYCADKFGKPIEDFGAHLGSDEADRINCRRFNY